MFVTITAPMYVSARPVGYMDRLANQGDYTLFPGEVAADYLMSEMSPRAFLREMGRGTIVPEGCKASHSKLVLYRTIYCFTCGWLP